MTIALTSRPAGDEPDPIELFSLDGVSYTIPAKPRANLALRYLYEAKSIGTDYAATNLLEALVGTDGYQALMNYDDLTGDQLQEVLDAAQKITLGTLESPKGR